MRSDSSNIKVFSIPGLRNSSPEHWQSHWEAKHKFIQRIHQNDWEAPNRNEWVNGIHDVLSNRDHDQTIITAHSVGCAAFVHWFDQYRIRIKAALLVAPSDVEHPDYPTYITGFSPLPLLHLPFKTVVVASSNDHVVSLDRARFFAKNWGSDLVILKDAGHIEPKAGFGAWEEGYNLLQQLFE